MRLFAAALLGATLTACGSADNEPGPGAVSVDEARALDDAAQMIEERRTPAEALSGEDEPTGESETQ